MGLSELELNHLNLMHGLKLGVAQWTNLSELIIINLFL